MVKLAAEVSRNAPCPCGSGKKYKHCCGKIGATPNRAPDPMPDLQAGLRLQQAGRLAEAEACYRQVLLAAPKSGEAHYLLGLTLSGQGRPEEAVDLMERAFSLGLKDAAAHFNYGNLLLDLSRPEQAIEQYQQALKRKPDFAEASNHLGNIYYENGLYAEAEAQYRRSLKHEPRNWGARYNLAHALYHQNSYDKAIEAFEKVIELDPARPEGYAGLGIIHELDNQPEQAVTCARQALERRPGDAGTLVLLARLRRREGDQSGALALLDTVEPSTVTELNRITLANERGMALDEIGRHDDAFAAFGESKRCLQEHFDLSFDRAAVAAELDRIEAYAAGPADMSSSDQRAGVPSLFVLGFHRSGTTLVEQILSSHANIRAGGELTAIERLQREIEDSVDAPFPDCLDRLDAKRRQQTLAASRRSYLTELKKQGEPAKAEDWIVDKYPLNSRHILCLHLLFPDAPIIRVVRHPLDTVLSAYFHNFREPNEWSFRLADAAWFYARLHRHIARMRAALNLRYLEVRYEDLVHQPESEIRRMLSFIGEPWDPDCLEFHKNRRVARTASYAQVTRELFDSSINRHLNYLGHVDDETLAHLEQPSAELGYEIDGSSAGKPRTQVSEKTGLSGI